MFNEIVLDAGFARVCENLLPGNDAAADFSEKAHLSVRAGGWRVFGFGKLLNVFHVDQREAAGILVEIFDGILAGNANPAKVEFHLDVLRVGGEEDVVGKFAAESVGRLKFKSMIVIGELDAGFLRLLTGFLEEIGGTLEAVGFGALLGVDPGADDEFVADGVRSFNLLGQFLFDDVVADVAGGGGQAILLEDLADVFWRMVKVAGKFDLSVADLGDLGDSAVEIGFHGVADGIELDADGFDFVVGGKGPREFGSEQGCGGRSDEGAAVHHAKAPY